MIEELMKEDFFFDLKYQNRKMYYEYGQWIVVEAKTPASHYTIVEKFDENDLYLAIACLKQ